MLSPSWALVEFWYNELVETMKREKTKDVIFTINYLIEKINWALEELDGGKQ